MSAKMGTVIVTCPGCGEALEAPVYLTGVTLGSETVRVQFADTSLEHKCKGHV